MDDTGTGQAFTALIHRALRAYRCDDELARLPQLADLAAVQAQRCAQPGLSTAAAVRSALDAGLERLAQIDREGADLLARRFVKDEPMAQVARTSDYSDSYLFKRQRQALAALAQVIWQAEERARRTDRLSANQEAALASLPPPTFSRLFGVSADQARLQRFLSAQDADWLTAVDGLGGIGKTALARAAVEELVRAGRFTRVVWLTARQQVFAWGGVQEAQTAVMTYADLLAELGQALALEPLAGHDEGEHERRVRLALAQQPTLVVLDNLETAADVRALVAGLDRLARPTKVLLTTRHRVGAYEGAVSLTLHELGREDAMAFIHDHARERNVQAAITASIADLERVAAVTDGNPLAIKLVLGQMHSRPLAVVLDDLAGARAGTRDFFRYIFRYSWKQLTPAAQRLLLHMPLLDARGTGWEQLAAVSGMAGGDEFWPAVDELVTCSLFNAGCSGDQMLYSIHRLTEYFILSDLVQLS